MSSWPSIAVAGLAYIALIAGCAKNFATRETVRSDALHGRALFATECAACHGIDAKGGGAASLGMGVVPPDLTLFSRRNGGVFPRNEVMSVIDGYFRREHVINPMPMFGDEDMGPTVLVEENGVATPIPANLLALANYLETLQQK